MDMRKERSNQEKGRTRRRGRGSEDQERDGGDPEERAADLAETSEGAEERHARMV